MDLTRALFAPRQRIVSPLESTCRIFLRQGREEIIAKHLLIRMAVRRIGRISLLSKQ
jgi:hypothetical protein